MELRHEKLRVKNMPVKLRLLHISDVHFSAGTTHEQNLRVIGDILALARQCRRIDAVCITGDLVSRKFSQESLDDAVLLVRRLREFLPSGEIFYSMGNHEMDLAAAVREKFKRRITQEGAVVLDNECHEVFWTWNENSDDRICFVGLTLPQKVFKNPEGGYLKLEQVTVDMIESCVGACPQHPCILLAHTPLGLSAYAQWGADIVLAGHVHGGIVRFRGTGFLSPERRFLPQLTKGVYDENGCMMNVSAGIGKFRMNNPAEVVYLEIG